MKNSITDIRNVVTDEELALEGTRKTLEDTITRLNLFETNLIENNVKMGSFSQNVEYIQGLKTKTEELDMRTRITDNYLEKYLVMFVQAQISETLHHCLQSTHKKRLHFYEEKKFKEFNAEILRDEGHPDIQKRMNSIHKLLETTIRRYSKSLAASSLGIRSRESEAADTPSSKKDRTRKGTMYTGSAKRASEVSLHGVSSNGIDEEKGEVDEELEGVPAHSTREVIIAKRIVD